MEAVNYVKLKLLRNTVEMNQSVNILKLHLFHSHLLLLACNHGHNILAVFDILLIFFSTQIKRNGIISNKHGIYLVTSPDAQ